jgi:hypothetical protein
MAMNIICSEEMMMISEEEKREIIEQAKQEFMLMMPDVIGNLMANHAAFAKMNSQFYKDHPEFVDYKHVVVSVIEKIDGDDTLEGYEEKLKKAVPIIRERIKIEKGLEMQKVADRPSRNFINYEPENNNGVF